MRSWGAARGRLRRLLGSDDCAYAVRMSHLPDNSILTEEISVPLEVDAAFQAACDALADLIVEAVERSLVRSDGKETHAPENADVNLIASLSCDTNKA